MTAIAASSPAVSMPERGKEDPAPRTIYLVDPHLRDGVGHYLDYALAIQQEAVRHGDRFIAFGARDVTEEVRNQLTVVPVFGPLGDSVPSRFRLLHAVRVALNLVRQSLSVFGALRRAAPRDSTSRETYFFPNASTLDVVGYALWVASSAPSPRRSYVLLLRYDHHIRGRHPQVLSAWLKLAFWLLRWRHSASVVRLTSDSAPLAGLYGSLSAHPFEVLPIPHVPPAGSDSPTLPAQDRSSTVCRFVYLGGWRSEQGVADLTDALILLRHEFEAGNFTAVVQANPRPSDREACVVRDRLKDADLPGVRVVESVLSREEFLDQLIAADVVLVPYSNDAYRYRTSGIFAEAVALGKPVITSRESWMSGELGDEPQFVFASNAPAELADAMRASANNLLQAKAAAARRQAEWTAFHNPASFYAQLVGDRREAELRHIARAGLP